MTVQTYNKMTKWFRGDERRVLGLKRANQLITAATYLIYILMVLGLMVCGDERWIRIVATTGISFIVVSVFRRCISCRRPYEVLDIEPLIPRNKTGKSFPSRHVFCIFVIAMSVYFLQPIAGVICFVAGVILAGIRVVAGIHFPKDVVAGAVLGILAGLIGYYIIPNSHIFL
jgi:membrane-associated phospholipid phosphatase